MTTKEMINVMTAYEKGAEIEYIFKQNIDKNIWETNVGTPLWNWANFTYRVKQPKQKLWYWEFKYDNGNEQWWKIYADRMTLKEASEKSALDYRVLEALGFIEE